MKTIAEVKKINQKINNHFFDRETMKFFNSKIESKLYKGKYFITSERQYKNLPKLFTIREARENGTILTIGEFQQFKTIEDARQYIKTL